MNDNLSNLRRLELREWAHWAAAIIVTLLLTLAIVSSTLPHVLEPDDTIFRFNLTQNVRGLVGLVLLFDVYTIYQQLQMSRLRARLLVESQAKAAIEVRAQELQEIAVLDPLTGLYNRRLCDERLEQELSRSLRHHRPLCVLLVDLDDFKHINDSHGHAAGDLALKECATHLKRATRTCDFVGRLGGDEFLVLLPDCAESQVSSVLSHIRPFTFGFKDEMIPVTFSIGYTESEQSDSPGALLERADRKLYEVKAVRKNASNKSGPRPSPNV